MHMNITYYICNSIGWQGLVTASPRACSMAYGPTGMRACLRAACMAAGACLQAAQPLPVWKPTGCC